MEPDIARRLSAEQDLDIELVVREFWEMVLLKELFASDVGDRLVFKGGTALRLAWLAPRYSDDLDFGQSGTVPFRSFAPVIRGIAARYPELEVTDLAAKFNTLLAEFGIRDPSLNRRFRIVVEVRRLGPVPPSELRLLSSPSVAFTVLARVETLAAIWTEKVAALASRRAPRDLFDLWFLGQKLNRALPGKPTLDVRVIGRDLRKYLPREYYPVIEELAR